MHAFLDLWGVVLDSDRMQRAYGERLADRLSDRFGGDRAGWLRAYDTAWEAYVRETDSTDWEQRPWAATVDDLDARFVLALLDAGGARRRPEDPKAYARELEFEVMASIDARFPDARTAVERLRTGGHRVYVATQASESNARGSLTGAGLISLLDGLFTGTSQDAAKTQERYWSGITASLLVPPTECVIVDDRLDYLRAAAGVGFAALLLDREGVFEGVPLPTQVRAVLRNLAGLPRAVELIANGELH